MSDRVFFFISGLGLGHATRTWAIIEALKSKRPNLVITIFCWGASTEFFRRVNFHQDVSITPLKPYLKENQKFYTANPVRLVVLLFQIIQTWFLNSYKLHSHLKSASQMTCVIDSDYHFLSYFFKKRKIIAISQTPFLFYFWRSNILSLPLMINIKFFFYKGLDLLYLKLFSDLTFSPTFFKVCSPSTKKVQWTPPIVRKEFLSANFATAFKKKIGVIGSGSKESHIMMEFSAKNNIDYIYSENNNFGLDESKRPLICNYEKIITQGGFSSLSECLSTNRKIILQPIPGHPEQFVNAAILSKEIPSSLKWERFDGAAIIANSILETFSHNS